METATPLTRRAFSIHHALTLSIAVAAATVNWVTQTAFAPPLVVVGVKTDSGAYEIVKNTKARLVVQHDPADFKALPKFPAYLD